MLFQSGIHCASPRRSHGNVCTHCRIAVCLRGLDIFLLDITDAINLGDASVLEDRCLKGLRETCFALRLPGESVAEGARNIRGRYSLVDRKQHLF
jgi:phycocyanin beta chain